MAQLISYLTCLPAFTVAYHADHMAHVISTPHPLCSPWLPMKVRCQAPPLAFPGAYGQMPSSLSPFASGQGMYQFLPF